MRVSKPAATGDALLTIAEILAGEPGSDLAGFYAWDGG
jgi:hypothetical protein